MKFRNFSLIAILFFIFAVSPKTKAQVVNTKKGKFEFIGLEKWTAKMVLDSLAIIAPDKPIGACAVDLKDHLGFADAAVTISQEDDGWSTVITVVEGQYRNKIVYKPTPPDTLNDIPAWENGIDIFTENQSEFDYGLYHYGYILDNQPDSAWTKITLWQADSLKIIQLFSFLGEHNTEYDKELAIWTLNNDGNYKNRIISAAILANFSESDLTWWTLFDCYRDSDGRVSTAARHILHTLSNHKNKKVNWAPVTSSIRHILDGTNLFALRQAIEVLIKTDISSDLCIPLLKDGGTLLLALLGANRESDKKLAHQLLIKLSRKDFDRDSAEWENWLRRL